MPALQTRTWQNVAIVCSVALPWAEAASAQELCCSCGLPHLHPPPSLSAPPTSPSARPSHPLSPLSDQSTQRSLGANQSGFLAKPLVLSLPRNTHQPWCHQQYFQKEGSEILFFLFFCAFKACLELRSGQFAHLSKVRSRSVEARGVVIALCHLLQ